MKLWRQLGRYDAETTTYSELAVSGASSPYTPDFNGKLIGLRVMYCGGAATSLFDSAQFKLTCTTFKPNSIECGGMGTGLRTAPAFAVQPQDWPVDQPVMAGVPVTIEGRITSVETNVTVDVAVWGCFEVS